MFAIFAKGVFLGFLIAAPVGPIGVLCINRSLRAGWRTGFLSGMGAATADAVYAAIAAFGLKAVIGTLTVLQHPLHLAGAALLCFLGLRTLRERPGAIAASPPALHSAFASTLAFATIVNPATIISFLAIFAAALGPGTLSATAATNIVLGVFTGSAIWWLTLALSAGAVRDRMTPKLLRIVNIASGCMLIAFSIYAAIS